MMMSRFKIPLILLCVLLSSSQAFAVCYTDLGCFESTSLCHLFVTPESPDEIGTRFKLYTESPMTPAEELFWRNDTNIMNSTFRPEWETKILIHGWGGDGSDLLGIKDAFLQKGDFNVIIVDWEKGAKSTGFSFEDVAKLVKSALNVYRVPRQNTRVVGREIGKLTEQLVSLKYAEYSTMHLIGFSLGAHVAGYAGESVSGKYGRITGLDPASILFQEFVLLPQCLLEKSDAKFVDIIHTDNLMGTYWPIGHQDLYPNGGKNQPSCPPPDPPCDHSMAVRYFIESIKDNCPFRAYPCSYWSILLTNGVSCLRFRRCGRGGCSRMGYFADSSLSTKSTFVLKTTKNRPYC